MIPCDSNLTPDQVEVSMSCLHAPAPCQQTTHILRFCAKELTSQCKSTLGASRGQQANPISYCAQFLISLLSYSRVLHSAQFPKLPAPNSVGRIHGPFQDLLKESYPCSYRPLAGVAYVPCNGPSAIIIPSQLWSNS